MNFPSFASMNISFLLLAVGFVFYDFFVIAPKVYAEHFGCKTVARSLGILFSFI